MGGSAGTAATREEATALAASVASLLLKNGQTSERAAMAVAHVGAATGYETTLFPAWGASLLRVATPGDAGGDRHVVVAADPAGVDMNKVARTLAVVDRLQDGGTDTRAAARDIAAIGALPPVSLVRFVVMAALGAAALGIIFGATRWPSLVLIAAGAGLGALVRRLLSQVARNVLVQPFAAALLAGLGGAWATRLGLSSPLHLVAVCPCMVLVPGPHLLNGILDLVHNRLVLGVARLVFAWLVVAMICVGLIAGLSLGGAALPATGTALPVPLVADVAAAGVAVAAYASFFAMPWRTVPAPVLVGMLAHGCRWAVLAAGASVETGALVACLLVGTIMTPLANRNHWPFAAVAFASVVSLIPGVFLFRMAAGIVELISRADAPADLPRTILADGTTAMLILLAMAFGLVAPKLLIERLRPPFAGRRS